MSVCRNAKASSTGSDSCHPKSTAFQNSECSDYNYYALKSHITTRHLKRKTDISFPCLLHTNGSITLEAALVLPLFIMVMAAFLFFFQLMSLQQDIFQGLTNAGWQAASVYHLENVLPDVFDSTGAEDEGSVKQKLKNYAGELLVTGITSVYVRQSVIDQAGEERLDKSCIKNGASGVTCYGYVDGSILKVGAAYEVYIPLLPEEVFSFRMTQQVTRRVWVGVKGDAPEESEETGEEPAEAKDIVYVTKHGTVYHVYRDCRSLKRSIRSCMYSKIGQQTNSEGAHYTPCELCIRGNSNALVYVTSEGRKYHNSISCAALLRYIEEIDKAEVGNKQLCSFCKKRKEDEDGAD